MKACKVKRSKIWRTILWREWLRQGRMILSAAWVWVFLFAVVPAVSVGLELWGLGLLLAMILGIQLGGSDSVEQAEEFAMTLPPQRLDYFFARLVAATGMLLVFIVGALVMRQFATIHWGYWTDWRPPPLSRDAVTGRPEIGFNLFLLWATLGLCASVFSLATIAPQTSGLLDGVCGSLCALWPFAGPE